VRSERWETRKRARRREGVHLRPAHGLVSCRAESGLYEEREREDCGGAWRSLSRWRIVVSVKGRRSADTDQRRSVGGGACPRTATHVIETGWGGRASEVEGRGVISACGGHDAPRMFVRRVERAPG
jgi:hypothetical protein